MHLSVFTDDRIADNRIGDRCTIGDRCIRTDNGMNNRGSFCNIDRRYDNDILDDNIILLFFEQMLIG